MIRTGLSGKYRSTVRKHRASCVFTTGFNQFGLKKNSIVKRNTQAFNLSGTKENDIINDGIFCPEGG